MLEWLQHLSIPIENLVKNTTSTRTSDLIIFTIIFILFFPYNTDLNGKSGSIANASSNPLG